jgi:hypothetical protein
MIAVLLVASSLCASEGEQVFSVGGEYVAAEGQGGGLSLRYTIGIDDFWNVTLDAGWARLIGDAAEGDRDRLGGGVGVLYHLDAFAWVPYAIFAVEADGFVGADQDEWGVGFELGGGLDYRPRPAWSVGLYALWHGVVYGDAPRHTSYGARVSTYF